MIEPETTTVVCPCLYICQIDDVSGICRGCFRTSEEIAGWQSATEDEKLAVLAAIDRRRAEHDPCGDEFRGDCDR